MDVGVSLYVGMSLYVGASLYMVVSLYVVVSRMWGCHCMWWCHCVRWCHCVWGCHHHHAVQASGDISPCRAWGTACVGTPAPPSPTGKHGAGWGGYTWRPPTP